VSILTSIVEGWTGRLEFTLYVDGVAFNGTGMTLTDVLVTGKDGTEVSTAGDFDWLVAASGTVYLDPDASDFVASKSPYRVRFKITDGLGKVVYFPNAQTDVILVQRARG
jgi:hypothetical protein